MTKARVTHTAFVDRSPKLRFVDFSGKYPTAAENYVYYRAEGEKAAHSIVLPNAPDKQLNFFSLVSGTELVIEVPAGNHIVFQDGTPTLDGNGILCPLAGGVVCLSTEGGGVWRVRIQLGTWVETP